MILITFVYQTIAYFFLTNLTLEPGYQIFLKLENLQDEFSKSVEKPTERLLTYKEILLNLDIDLILVSVFMAGFMCSQFETSINIIAITNFQWSINYLGLLSIIAMLLAAVLMKLLSKLNCEISINFQSVILLINYSILINLMSLPLVFITQSRNLEVIFIMTSLVLYLIGGYNIRYLFNNLLFLIVPSHSRCFIVGVVQVMYQISLASGYFTASFLLEWGTISYPCLASLCLLISIARLVRSHRFIEKYVNVMWNKWRLLVNCIQLTLSKGGHLEPHPFFWLMKNRLLKNP